MASRHKSRVPGVQQGEAETIDLENHPRLVAVGIMLIILLGGLGVAGLASFVGTGDEVLVDQVVVPRTAGRTAKDAQAQLERLGLIVEVAYESNEVVRSGVVVDQKPIGGSRIDAGELVTLQVSDGPAGIKIPDVKSLNSIDASQVLETVGLKAKSLEVYDETVRAGEVVGSSPAAGARVALGGTVEVRVSKGPKPRVVPDVVGLSDAEAFVAIARADLKIGKVSHKRAAGPSGTVLSLSPAAGSDVPRDQPVNVVISSSDVDAVVPDLVGMVESSAARIAREVGVRVSSTRQSVPPGDGRDGVVLSQEPPAGTPASGDVVVKVAIGKATQATPSTEPTVPGGARGGG